MTLKVFIGYDYREAIAYHVLSHSILRRASGPVSIEPVMLSQLDPIVWWRPRSPNQSTDFTFARFLVPWLSNYHPQAIFLDCDMLCLGDIYDLKKEAMQQPYADVCVVKHDYEPCCETKFLGQVQTVYPCKNWSSVMVFNGHRQPVRNLTPIYVNNAPAMDLHQFKWAERVGELPREWNHLVGEYEPNHNAKLVHFTLGGPWHQGYDHCEFADEWGAELQDMLHRDNASFELIRNWL